MRVVRRRPAEGPFHTHGHACRRTRTRTRTPTLSTQTRRRRRGGRSPGSLRRPVGTEHEPRPRSSGRRPSCAIQKREVPCAEPHPAWLVGGDATQRRFRARAGSGSSSSSGSCGPGPGPGTVPGHRRPVLELSVGGALSSRGTIWGRRANLAGWGRAGRGLFGTGRRRIAEVPVPVWAGLGPLQSLLPGSHQVA
jgi:hypothetical protein